MRNRSWQKGGKIGINADGMYDLTYKSYNYDVSNIIPKIMFLTKQNRYFIWYIFVPTWNTNKQVIEVICVCVCICRAGKVCCAAAIMSPTCTMQSIWMSTKPPAHMHINSNKGIYKATTKERTAKYMHLHMIRRIWSYSTCNLSSDDKAYYVNIHNRQQEINISSANIKEIKSLLAWNLINKVMEYHLQRSKNVCCY